MEEDNSPEPRYGGVMDSLLEGHPLECSICLERMKDISSLTTAPDENGVCTHYFCTSCINPLFQRSSSAKCPSCRRLILRVTRSKVANELLSEIEVEREGRKKALLEKQEISGEFQVAVENKKRLENEIEQMKKSQADEITRTLDRIDKYRRACEIQVEDEKKDKEKQVKSLNLKLEKLTKQYDDAARLLENQKQTELTKKEKRKLKREEFVKSFESKYKEMESNLLKNQKELEFRMKEMESKNIQLEMMTQENNNIRREIDLRTKLIREQENKIRTLQERNNQLSDEGNELGVMRMELESKTKEIHSLSSEIQKFRSMYLRANEELNITRRKSESYASPEASSSLSVSSSTMSNSTSSLASLSSWMSPSLNKIASPLSYLWSKAGPLVKPIAEFQFLERRGSSRYSNVWKSSHKMPNNKVGKIVAVKKIQKERENYSKNNAMECFREALLLFKLEHNNILKLNGIIRDSTVPGTTTTGDFLVIPFLPYDLEYVLSGQTTFKIKPNHIKFILYQLLSAMFYLHSGEVVHRDIRPTSILLDEACNIKLGGFSSASSVLTSQGRTGNATSLSRYSAPENCFSENRTSDIWKSGDMWSIGCVFFEMLKGYPLFESKEKGSLLYEICGILDCRPSSNDVHNNPVLNNYLTQKSLCKTLVDQLQSIPTSSSGSISPSSSFSSVEITPDILDLLQKMLKFDPMKRITCKEALKHKYFDSPEISIADVQLRTCSSALSSELQDGEILTFLNEQCGGV